MRSWILAGACALLIPVASSRAEPARHAQSSAQTSVPAYLRIVRAEITERGPFSHARMAERGVVFRIVTAESVQCSASRARPISYTFVIDAWPWISTDKRLDLAPELRAHAKVELSCQGSQGWRSSVPGRITDRENTLELTTTLAELPS